MRAILTYHSIDDTGSPISVAPAAFQDHLRWLASGAVRVLSLEHLVSDRGGSDAVAVTFDDGIVTIEEPLDELRRHGLPVTVFVASAHVGRTNQWRGATGRSVPEWPLLSWDQLARLAHGGVTIGAHTRTHPRLTEIQDGQLEDELAGCSADINRYLGREPDALAYPYGAVDARVAAAAARTFARAVTTEFRAIGAEDDPLRLPRLDMYYFNRTGALARWGTAAFERRLWAVRTRRRLREVVTAC